MKVKLRIAVAILKNGDYSVGGWREKGKQANDKQMFDAAESVTEDETYHRCFVEAEVDVPDLPTIPGRVV